MKKSKKIRTVVALVMLCAVMLFSSVVISSAVEESTFEQQLEAFPESYHHYLRELHEKYPEWNFVAFETGLDWNDVIDNEHDDYALVYNPDAARIFKSLDEDDYDAVNDRFYYKDGSFVAASRIAVEYFMDPRNFLDIGGIFQFELLSFSSLYTEEMVEAVLENSFMADTKMTWLDESGKSHTSKLTYAQAIYKAGETYDINPCFLASKILNEVGSSGSDSVSGTNAEYPGVYNFYNIGATDGAGAVERGLYWALGSGEGKTTYSRPWTTPYKSIMGGAEFLAEEYIAAGQYTGYLQRFNVNPESDYELYTHQYMSNLTGALSQGYSTYRSYREMGMLEESLTFSIPVYENMSNADGSGKLVGAETTEQYGTIKIDYRYVRTGPSVDHDILTDTSGNNLFVEKGEEVKVLNKVDTDAYYYEEILTYPYWYRVAFKRDGKTYKGYIPASRVEIKTGVFTKVGKADIAFAKSGSVNNQIASSDPSKVRIIDSDTVEFLKKGYVKLYLYDSYGLFEEILFKVGNYESYYASSVKVTVTGNKAKVISAKHETAESYGYTLCDKLGNIVKPEFTKTRSRVFENLRDGAVYDVFVQNCYGKYIYTKAIQKPVVIKPAVVENLDFTKDSSGVSTLYWDGLADATGYQIMEYNKTTDKYTKIATVSYGTNSYTLSASQCKKADNYVVRAYSKYDGELVYGDYSQMISLSDKAPTPSDVVFTDKSTSGFTISWTGNDECDGYRVYVATPEIPEHYYYKTVTDTSLKISGYTRLTYREYKIRSYINTSKGKIYSDFTPVSAVLTRPETVKNLSLSSTATTVNASWDAVDTAEYYMLYYKEGSGEYNSVRVDGTSYKLTGLASNTDYRFYVKAVAEMNSVLSSGKACESVAIRTRPAVPRNLSVSYRGYNHIELTWTKNERLDSYRVYYMDASGKVLGSVAATNNKATINGLSAQTTYKFKIRGYVNDGENKVASEYSSVVTSKTSIPKVENYSISEVTETSFKLSWDKLEGVTNYNVYYKKDGVYKKIKKPTTNSCVITSLPESSKGYFYITATFGKKKLIESEKTKTFSVSLKPAKVTGITLAPSRNNVTVKWDKMKSADGYRVYLVKNGSYVLQETLEGNICTIKGLKECTSVKISVRAYRYDSFGTAYGKHSEKSVYTHIAPVTKMTQSNKTDTSYTLSWTAPSSKANRYYLYRYNEKTKDFERIATTSKTSYDVKKMTPGTNQRYTIMATYVKNGKVIAKSDKVCNFVCGTYLSKTENLRVAESTTSSLTLKWDKVAGATGYRVYYYSTATKGFKLYKEVSKNSISISGLASGTTYYFAVNALRRTETAGFLGYYSSILAASTK